MLLDPREEDLELVDELDFRELELRVLAELPDDRRDELELALDDLPLELRGLVARDDDPRFEDDLVDAEDPDRCRVVPDDERVVVPDELLVLDPDRVEVPRVDEPRVDVPRSRCSPCRRTARCA